MSVAPEDIGLISVDTNAAGYMREAHDDGWRFYGAQGKALPAKETKRLNSLVIPPAWQDVWISPDSKGHILAYGNDEAGRRQYIYHPKFRDARETAKFEKLPDFAKALPRLRKDVSRILDNSDDLERLAVATIVRLLDESGLRIGNARFQKRSGVRGATTLVGENVTIDNNLITLDFVAKGGKHRCVEIEDEALAEVISELKDEAGRDLFSAKDFNIESNDVNAYLQDTIGNNFTAKDFRTWGGSVVATETLRKNDKVSLKLISENAAAYLGNTKTIARNSYIHPAIIDMVKEQNELPKPSGPTRLYAAERMCFAIITQP